MASSSSSLTTSADVEKTKEEREAKVPPGFELIEEGSVKMIFPKEANCVFYNPVQVQNRDLSILMIQLYAERRWKEAQCAQQRKTLYRQAMEALQLYQQKQQQQESADKANTDRMETTTTGDTATTDNDKKKDSTTSETGDGETDKKLLTLDDICTRSQVDQFVKEQLQLYESSQPWSKLCREATSRRFSEDSPSSSSSEKKESPSEFRGLRILDALAASGLRSLRYYQEVPAVRQVVINDLDPVAVQQARDNVALNGLEGASGLTVQCADATHVMYTSRRPPHLLQLNVSQKEQMADQYDVIDLDPYGSAAPFLDGAVQAVVDGGMLNVTCTDMAAMGGSHPETCFGRYNAMPIPRGRYLQEVALRILLKELATTAAKYGRTIRPILSVGMAFYIRVFVQVRNDKAGVNDLSLQIGSLYQSTQCPSFHTVPLGQHGSNKNVYQPARAPQYSVCQETGGPFKVGGPLWLGPLHDFSVVDEAVSRLEEKAAAATDESPAPLQQHLATRAPLHGLLTVVSEELPDVPLYYTLPDLCQTLQCASPPLQAVKAALVNAGYRVSAYHKEPQAIKTDAPNAIVWDVMRAWCQKHPPVSHSSKKSRKRERRKAKKKQEGKRRHGDPNGKEKTDDKGEANKDDNDKNKAGENGATEMQEDAEEDKDEAPTSTDAHVSAGAKILAVEPSIAVDFSIPPGFARRKKAQRYPLNPQPHWGPKPRASGKSRPSSNVKEVQDKMDLDKKDDNDDEATNSQAHDNVESHCPKKPRTE